MASFPLQRGTLFIFNRLMDLQQILSQIPERTKHLLPLRRRAIFIDATIVGLVSYVVLSTLVIQLGILERMQDALFLFAGNIFVSLTLLALRPQFELRKLYADRLRESLFSEEFKETTIQFGYQILERRYRYHTAKIKLNRDLWNSPGQWKEVDHVIDLKTLIFVTGTLWALLLGLANYFPDEEIRSDLQTLINFSVPLTSFVMISLPYFSAKDWNQRIRKLPDFQDSPWISQIARRHRWRILSAEQTDVGSYVTVKITNPDPWAWQSLANPSTYRKYVRLDEQIRKVREVFANREAPTFHTRGE